MRAIRSSEHVPTPLGGDLPGDVAAIDADIGIAWLDAVGNVLSANASFWHLLSGDASEPAALDGRHLPTLIAERGVADDPCAGAADFHVELTGADRSDRPRVRLAGSSVRDGRRLVVAQHSGAAVAPATPIEPDANIDPLTGLGNRRLLDELLAERAASPDGATPLAVVLVDLDRFKRVNDTLGHGVGDRLLELVSERMRRAAGAADTLIRLGGDEFVVVREDGGGRDGAEQLAHRLVDLMGRPFLIGGQQIDIGASVGIALFDPPATTPTDVLRHADLALHAAKAAGRGTHRCFEARLETEAQARRALELALRRALGLRQFELYYQPQVTVPEATVSGFEALIRWHLPRCGIVSPDEFIPLAEETGDIVAIGEWVLRSACLEATTWPEHLDVAVNVSPVQFESERFLDSVVQALRESGLPPARLELEVTEGVLVADPARAIRHLQAVRDLGIGVAMDDFGTGYSSLSYLNSFPFSKIKIDRSFIYGEQSERSRALVRTILTLGASLGMKTMAEGVETREQFDLLAQGGCTGAQGYLFSKPMSADRIRDFLDSDKSP